MSNSLAGDWDKVVSKTPWSEIGTKYGWSDKGFIRLETETKCERFFGQKLRQTRSEPQGFWLQNVNKKQTYFLSGVLFNHSPAGKLALPVLPPPYNGHQLSLSKQQLLTSGHQFHKRMHKMLRQVVIQQVQIKWKALPVTSSNVSGEGLTKHSWLCPDEHLSKCSWSFVRKYWNMLNINCSDLFAVDREADFHLYCADSCFALNWPLAVDRLVDTARESHSHTVSHLVPGSKRPVNCIGLYQDEQRPF